MCDVIKECAACKQKIEINIHNIHDIARAKTKYYHTACLKEYAQKRIKKEKHDSCWDYVIDHIPECETDAKEIIYKRYWQDLLNEHLLKHYDVITIPNRFWEIVMDLHNGIHKRKKCRPVHMETLYGTWLWGQARLDSIARKNRHNKTGPTNDSERLNYDLAIVMKHIPDYLKFKAKCEVEEAARREREKEKIKINYSNFRSAPVCTEGLDDISELLDEF